MKLIMESFRKYLNEEHIGFDWSQAALNDFARRLSEVKEPWQDEEYDLEDEIEANPSNTEAQSRLRYVQNLLDWIRNLTVGIPYVVPDDNKEEWQAWVARFGEMRKSGYFFDATKKPPGAEVAIAEIGKLDPALADLLSTYLNTTPPMER